jgi:hypothetical protein
MSILIMSISFSCGSRPSLELYPKKRGILAEQFTQFDIAELKVVVVKCDLGWHSLNIIQYQYPKIEIHKTYQKYVHLDIRNDTLFVFTENTPIETENLSIHKAINIYAPNLSSVSCYSSKVVLKDMNSKLITIDNLDNSLRLYNCKIQNLIVNAKGTSTVQLYNNNYFKKLQAKMNVKSYFNSSVNVLRSFTLTKKTLDNTSFHYRPEKGFHWVRN